MPSNSGLSRLLLPVGAGLLGLGLLTTLPIQAQTAGHNSSSRRDYYYPQSRDPYRSPSNPEFSGPVNNITIVRPVIIDNRIQNSTVVGPVISPQTQRSVPSQGYPTQAPYPASQPARRTDAACMAFNEQRIACQL